MYTMGSPEAVKILNFTFSVLFSMWAFLTFLLILCVTSEIIRNYFLEKSHSSH